jgi:hypothetical protein
MLEIPDTSSNAYLSKLLEQKNMIDKEVLAAVSGKREYGIKDLVIFVVYNQFCHKT